MSVQRPLPFLVWLPLLLSMACNCSSLDSREYFSAVESDGVATQEDDWAARQAVVSIGSFSLVISSRGYSTETIATGPCFLPVLPENEAGYISELTLVIQPVAEGDVGFRFEEIALTRISAEGGTERLRPTSAIILNPSDRDATREPSAAGDTLRSIESLEMVFEVMADGSTEDVYLEPFKIVLAGEEHVLPRVHFEYESDLDYDPLDLGLGRVFLFM